MRMQQAHLRALFIFIGTLGVSNAHGALLLSLVPEVASPVVAGSVVPIDLELTGLRTTPIVSIELTLSTLTGGAAYVAQGQNTDGFAESSTLTNDLPVTTDGSLFDDLSLGYTTFDSGIPTGTDTLILGTFWVKTPANVSGSYPVSLVFSDLLDADSNQVMVVNSGTTVLAIASTPEPSAGLMLCAPAFILLRLRRRSLIALHD